MAGLFLPVLAALFLGAAMKAADLIEDNGFRFFAGDAAFLALASGTLAAYLVAVDAVLANIVLAAVAAFGLRGSIDAKTHAVPAAFALAAFYFTAPLQLEVLVPFAAIFYAAGAFKDAFSARETSTAAKHGPLYWFVELSPAYAMATFAFALYAGYWLPFAVFTSRSLGYNAVKLALEKS